jgi:hypothetical protein
MNCQVCNTNNAEWAWQPFGPSDKADTFTTLGSHYRGFPVVKICDECKETAKSGSPLQFTLSGATYIGDRDQVWEVPKYVVDGDPLLWWNETGRFQGDNK